MSEQYTKVEIIRTPWNAERWATNILTAVLNLALATLIVWWFTTAWFPEKGWTYWQLILPVFVAKLITGRGEIGRLIAKSK